MAHPGRPHPHHHPDRLSVLALAHRLPHLTPARPPGRPKQTLHLPTKLARTPASGSRGRGRPLVDVARLDRCECTSAESADRPLRPVRSSSGTAATPPAWPWPMTTV